MASGGHHDILIQGDFVQTPSLGTIEIFRNYLIRKIFVFPYEVLLILNLHRYQ